MKKIICFLLVGFLICTKAYANIGVFPQAVDFSENGRKRSQTLNIINQSKKIQTYRVSIEEYNQDENGKYVKTKSVANSAQKYLIYSPKQFTLMPGKVQSIRIARKGLGDAQDGEYVSHLVVSEVLMPQSENVTKDNKENNFDVNGDMKEFSINIRTIFAISVPVTIYKGKSLKQDTKILSYTQNGDKLNLVLQRKGNISSRLNFKVLDAKGEEIGRVQSVRIYTPNGKRNLSINLKSGTKPAKLELYDVLTNKKISEQAL